MDGQADQVRAQISLYVCRQPFENSTDNRVSGDGIYHSFTHETERSYSGESVEE
jgi:hypothetical protein